MLAERTLSVRPAPAAPGIETVAQAEWLRRYLEPWWERTHRMWGEMPAPASRWMCRYTGEFVRLLDPSWRLVFGHVDRREPRATHVWCERLDGPYRFLDLTGDQFAGLPPVQLRPDRPPRYREGGWPSLSDTTTFRRRATRWAEALTPPPDRGPPARPAG